MANSKQSKKRARQQKNRRAHTVGMLSMMRTHLKNTTKAIAAGEKEKAAAAYQKAASVVDKMATKGLIHKNKANRHKSRLNAALKKLAA